MTELLLDKFKLSYYRLKFHLLTFTRFKYYNYNKYKPFKSINVDKILIDLRNNGYCVIENYLNNDECEEIKNNINNYIIYNKNNVWTDDLYSDFRIYGFNHVCKITKKIFFSSELLEISKRYVGCKMENIFTMAGKLTYTDKNSGSGGGWHRDSINPSIKSLIYIDDVDEKRGPLQIIQDSNKFKNIILDNKKMNKKKMLDIRYKNDQVLNIDDFKIRLKQFNLKKGSMIVFDGSNIHRGMPICNDFRFAITNYYFPLGKMTQKKYPVRPQVFN